MIEIAVFCNGWIAGLNCKGFSTNPFPVIIVGMEYGLSVPERISDFYIEKYSDDCEKNGDDKILQKFICHI